MHDVAYVIVDGGDAREVELCGGDAAGQDLEADGQKAAGRGPVVVIGRRQVVDMVATAVVSSRPGGEQDEANGKERNVGWVLAAHCNLDCIDIDRRIDDEAAGGVGAALLEHQFYMLGGVAGSLYACMHKNKVRRRTQLYIYFYMYCHFEKFW